MKFIPSRLYHVYNQGNNQETIFKCSGDYLLFLKKVRKLILPQCEILAYNLMPNHFHFMIMASVKSAIAYQLSSVETNELSNAFRLLLSEYAQDFNKTNNRSGSLFRQKTKAKDLSESSQKDAPLFCFNYIHNNASEAGLVKFSKEWEFCSLKDFLGLRNGTLCNQALAFDLLGIDENYIKEMALHF
ncbi:MAG: transposase [Sphingobacteriales bacterium]|nr:MAG: transposase [Sphingobacteriales bacterium]